VQAGKILLVRHGYVRDGTFQAAGFGLKFAGGPADFGGKSVVEPAFDGMDLLLQRVGIDRNFDVEHAD
jgi:hypothetical protein